MSFQVAHLVIKRAPDNAPFNYRVIDEHNDVIGEVNWLNIRGARVGFDHGKIEVGGIHEVDLANETDDDNRRASGAFVRET